MEDPRSVLEQRTSEWSIKSAKEHHRLQCYSSSPNKYFRSQLFWLQRQPCLIWSQEGASLVIDGLLLDTLWRWGMIPRRLKLDLQAASPWWLWKSHPSNCYVLQCLDSWRSPRNNYTSIKKYLDQECFGRAGCLAWHDMSRKKKVSAIGNSSKGRRQVCI